MIGHMCSHGHVTGRSHLITCVLMVMCVLTITCASDELVRHSVTASVPELYALRNTNSDLNINKNQYTVLVGPGQSLGTASIYNGNVYHKVRDKNTIDWSEGKT